MIDKAYQKHKAKLQWGAIGLIGSVLVLSLIDYLCGSADIVNAKFEGCKDTIGYDRVLNITYRIAAFTLDVNGRNVIIKKNYRNCSEFTPNNGMIKVVEHKSPISGSKSYSISSVQ